MKAKRQSIESVFGMLKEFMGLRKVNTLGIDKANKCMHLAAIAYNLKKHLKFTKKSPISQAGVVFSYFFVIKILSKASNKLFKTDLYLVTLQIDTDLSVMV